jgi:hypothetical protein
VAYQDTAVRGMSPSATKDPDGPKLVTSPTARQAFTATVKAGLPL